MLVTETVGGTRENTAGGGQSTRPAGGQVALAVVTCARHHLDSAQESLPVLQVHHLSLDLILNHVNQGQLRYNALYQSNTNDYSEHV